MSSPSRRPYGRRPSSEDEAELGSSKRVLAEHARRSRSRSRQRASTAVGSSSPTIDNNANTLSQSSSHLALSEARRRGRSVSRQRLDSSSHSKNAAPPIRGRSSSRSGGGGRISSAGLSSLKDQLASFETPKRTSSGLKYPSSLYFEAARGLSSGDDSLQSSESSSHHGGGGLASFLTPPVSTNQNRTQLNSLHAAANNHHHLHQGTSSDDSDNQSLADFWQDEEHPGGGEAQEKPSSTATTNFARQTSLDSSQSSFMGGTSWNPTSFYQNQLHQHMDEVEDTVTFQQDHHPSPPQRPRSLFTSTSSPTKAAAAAAQPPSSLTNSMQEGIKSLQRQAVSQLGLGTTTGAPPNCSNNNAPTTFRSAPKPDASFSSSKYFSQRDDFEHVDQSINLMDSTMDMMEQNSKSANRRRGKRPAKDLSKSKLNQDLSQRKLNQNLSQRNVLSSILTMDNSSNRNNTNHSIGANRKWWFPNWFARRGSNKRGSTNEVVLPSPPPPPSNLGNNSQNYLSSTSSSSSPSAFRNTLFTVCIVCQATCYSRRRLLLIVLLVMAMAATMIHVSILAHRMVQHNRLEDKLSSLDREGEMVEILVRKNITSPQALSDETQPASMALQWLVERDPAHLATRHELLHDLVPRFVLTTLYFATTTTTNKKKNQTKKKWTHETHWLTGKHVCEWHGITCTTKGGQRSNSILTQMNLTNNQLQGRLPLELKALSDMRILDLSYNAIQGPIWEDWTMGWTQLRSFRFQHNQGTGALPQRWNMPHLQELVLIRNKFRGTVPSFGQHHMLKVLYLQDNKFSGSLPSKSMASWTKMRFLHLHNNQLGGSIPDTIGGMTLLEELSLQGNDLVGAIPASISSLSGLEMLRLGDNALTGSIPEVFGNLVKLTDLQLSSNRFRSLLPTSIGGLPKLKWFAIDASGMTGYIPKEWKGMTNLEVLLLHENDLVSSLDGELLRALNKLRQLSLHTNFFRGSLPSEVGLLSDLKELLLQTNDLRGPLPSEIGNLQKLVTLKTSQNHLTGSVPEAICKLRKHHNKLYTLEADCKGSIHCDCCTACM